jgi:hypothetical protein
MEIKKGVNATMYTFNIQVEAEGPLFPKELKNPELAELAVEGAVACYLENLFSYVSIKNVTISRSSQTENKKEANGPTYTIKIHIEADATVFPYELKNIELAEIVVEGAVACSLQGLFTEVIMKEVTISRSPREVEQDWDALLSQNF